MSTIMDMRVAKFNNKEGYKVNVNKSKYMLFKSRDHFKKISRMVFDLVRFALSGKEDKKEIILSRMISIEKYLKTLNLTKVKVFDENYDPFSDEPEPDDYDDAFEIMFSSLCYFFMTTHILPPPYSNYYLFQRKLKTKEMKKKFKDLRRVMDEIIITKYQ